MPPPSPAQPLSPKPVKSKRHAPPSPPPPDDLDLDVDRRLLSKSYFDMKELDRAAYALEGCTGKRAIFQRLYYTFLAGERRREEEAGEVLGWLHLPFAQRPATYFLNIGPLDPVRNANRSLPDIEVELAALYGNGERDPFICYL